MALRYMERMTIGRAAVVVVVRNGNSGDEQQCGQRCAPVTTENTGKKSYSELELAVEMLSGGLADRYRKDMIAALKSRDTTRLNVLRGLLADTTNASKTSSPIKTDLNLLALLRKRVVASKAAAQEFASANRDDLKEKEESQVAVLEEYASKIDAVGEEEVREAVEQTVDELKKEGTQLKFGAIMARVTAKGGPLANRPVEKSLLARVLKSELERTPRTDT